MISRASYVCINLKFSDTSQIDHSNFQIQGTNFKFHTWPISGPPYYTPSPEMLMLMVMMKLWKRLRSFFFSFLLSCTTKEGARCATTPALASSCYLSLISFLSSPIHGICIICAAVATFGHGWEDRLLLLKHYLLVRCAWWSGCARCWMLEWRRKMTLLGTDGTGEKSLRIINFSLVGCDELF